MPKWLLAVWIGVVAVSLVGLVPYKVSSTTGLRSQTKCRGVLVEAWPERDSGWFTYAVSSRVMTEAQYNDAVCGAEARRRMLTPTVVVAAVLLAATVVLAAHRPRSRIDE